MTENRDAQAPSYSAAEISALAHLYRGEMYRSTVWRTRLDTTTNWSVVTTGIALSGDVQLRQATPLPIVLISFLLAAFLLFEARRYQYFDIWNTRLRVIEACFYDPMRAQGSCTDRDWNEVLADDLKQLQLHMGLLDAVGLRLRRNWLDFRDPDREVIEQDRVHPTPLASFSDLWERTAVGPVPAGRLGGRRLIFTSAFWRSVSSPSVRSTGSNET